MFAGELKIQKSYLEDSSGTLSIGEVENQPTIPFEGVLSEGYSASTFWIRLAISDAPATEPLVLTVNPAYLDDVKLVASGTDPSLMPLGIFQGSSGHTPPFLGHAFFIPPDTKPQVYWLRIQSRTSIIVNTNVAPLSVALTAESRRNFLSALYIGCLAIFIMVGIALACISDEPATRVFPIYETAVAIFSLNLFGYISLLFYPHLPPEDASGIHQYATIATTLGAGVFHTLFLRSVGASRKLTVFAGSLFFINLCGVVFIAVGSVRPALQLNAFFALAYPVLFFSMALSLPRSRSPDFPKNVVVLYYTVFLLITGPMAAQLLGLRPLFDYVFFGNIFHGFMSGLLMLTLLVWRTLRIWEQERLSTENLTLAIDGTQLGIWTFDPVNSEFHLSEICKRQFGYANDPSILSEEKLISAVHSEDRAMVEASLLGAAAGDKDFSVEHRVVWPDGSVHWLLGRGRSYFSKEGKLQRIGGITIDVSDRKAIDEANKANLAMIKATFESVSEALVIGDTHGNIKFVNNAAAVFFHCESTEEIPREFKGFNSLVRLAEIDGGVLNAEQHPLLVAAGGEKKSYGLKVTRLDTHESWYALVNSAPVLDESGVVIGVATAWLDVSELIQLQRNLEHRVLEKTRELDAANKLLSEMSRHDALTGLHNRMACDERLAIEFESMRKTADCYSLLMVDIDHFKLVNDTYGHATGDEVLKMVSGVFSRNLRKHDYAARWGGEEFLILLPSTGIEHASVVADKLRIAVASETHSKAGTVHVSIGVSMASPQDLDESAALLRADAALYDAKGSGRNRVVARSA